MGYSNEIRYIEAKSILSKLRGNDTLFGLTYNMNLYRGCQHGCIYCDTRSECYQINDISSIAIKTNALDLLRKELPSKRKSKGTIGTGSMNDPYMPIEKDMQMMRQALLIISDHKFPVHIITKSNLVERDIDILQDISKTYAAVSFTITCADDELSRKIEPNASVTSDRLKAIELLAKNGIYTGVTLMPLLPYINDTAANIESIIRRAKDAGASYINPMFGVTLRKGSRDYFYNELDKIYPSLRRKYQSQFGEQYICNSPNYSNLTSTYRKVMREVGMSSKMEFYKPIEYIQQSLF